MTRPVRRRPTAVLPPSCRRPAAVLPPSRARAARGAAPRSDCAARCKWLPRRGGLRAPVGCDPPCACHRAGAPTRSPTRVGFEGAQRSSESPCIIRDVAVRWLLGRCNRRSSRVATGASRVAAQFPCLRCAPFRRLARAVPVPHASARQTDDVACRYCGQMGVGPDRRLEQNDRRLGPRPPPRREQPPSPPWAVGGVHRMHGTLSADQMVCADRATSTSRRTARRGRRAALL
jgi:hypothetical protein